jgi:hypothetical protein
MLAGALRSGLTEELLFHGAILAGVLALLDLRRGRRLGMPRVAAGVGAVTVAFVAVHFVTGVYQLELASIVQLALGGAALSLLYLRAGLASAVLAHAAADATIVIVNRALT